MALGARDVKKEEGRRGGREAREGLSEGEREAKSAAIARRVVGLKVFREAGTVLAYRSVGSEVETGGLIAAALRAGKRVGLPVSVWRGRRLVFREVTGLEGLRPGLGGIPEPGRGCAVVGVGEAQVALVPGTAFDEEGWRIGAGAGFYDRFLAKNRGTVRVGLAFEAQVAERVPHGEGDERMDLIVTEKRVIRCGRRV